MYLSIYVYTYMYIYIYIKYMHITDFLLLNPLWILYSLLSLMFFLYICLFWLWSVYGNDVGGMILWRNTRFVIYISKHHHHPHCIMMIIIKAKDPRVEMGRGGGYHR
jgi:formate/nitrite transporter FocA (FNT family)